MRKMVFGIPFAMLLVLTFLPKELISQATGTLRTQSFKALFSGALVRDAHSKAADIVSLKDFGAKGDGTTDDTAAFVAAIANSSLAQCIFVPDAVYTVKSALTTDHPICFTGGAWRIKYIGTTSILNLFSIVGDPIVYPPNTPCTYMGTPLADCYGTHTTFMHGSFIKGMILDGGTVSAVQNGLNLQGVVAATMDQIWVTNVTDVGVLCFWCQQVTFEHVTVSSNYEAFTTVPQRCIVIDDVSSANVIKDINCEHVGSNGIDLVWALNTTTTGGTSEGNGGYGMSLSGNVPGAPDDDGTGFHYNLNNITSNLDMEENHPFGDVYIGDQCYFNTWLGNNSFTNPGITFDRGAHNNTFAGGSIGTGSTAGPRTSGNRLVNMSTIDITGATVWFDNGANYIDAIYNQFNNNIVEPINGYNGDWTIRNGPVGSREIHMYSPNPGLVVDITAGLFAPGDQWVGMFSQKNQFAQIHYNDNLPDINPGTGLPIPGTTGKGFCFVGEHTLRSVTGTIDGCILQHNWGIGTAFSPSYPPLYTLHVQGAVSTTVGLQAGPGQGGTYILDIRDNTLGQLSGISNLGIFKGATESFGGSFSVSGCTVTGGSIKGGATAGEFVVTGSPSTCTVVMGTAAGQPVLATNHWACYANGSAATTNGGPRPISVSGANTIVITVPAAQTIIFGCIGY